MFAVAFTNYCHCCLTEVFSEEFCSYCKMLSLIEKACVMSITGGTPEKDRVQMAAIILEGTKYTVVDSQHNEYAVQEDYIPVSENASWKETVRYARDIVDKINPHSLVGICKALVRESGLVVVMKEI